MVKSCYIKSNCYLRGWPRKDGGKQIEIDEKNQYEWVLFQTGSFSPKEQKVPQHLGRHDWMALAFSTHTTLLFLFPVLYALHITGLPNPSGSRKQNVPMFAFIHSQADVMDANILFFFIILHTNYCNTFGCLFLCLTSPNSNSWDLDLVTMVLFTSSSGISGDGWLKTGAW